MFKKAVVKILRDHIERNEDFKISWKCNECSHQYRNGNLLKKTKAVVEEYRLDGCQPDIALLDQRSMVIGVIEIVNTHEPDSNALDYYKHHGITMIQLNVEEDDLKDAVQKLTKPDIVNYCGSPECSVYDNHRTKKEYLFLDQKCKHGHSVKRCIPVVETVFGKIPTKMSLEDLDAASNNSVIIEQRNDPKTNQSYLLHICPRCVKIKKGMKPQRVRFIVKPRKIYSRRRF
jgi:hypothetical protein